MSELSLITFSIYYLSALLFMNFRLNTLLNTFFHFNYTFLSNVKTLSDWRRFWQTEFLAASWIHIKYAMPMSTSSDISLDEIDSFF
jgi:hypothetical protein